MVRFIGHRGNRVHSPENTLHAFRLAKEQGVDCVEFDVMLTKDGEAIVFHDETLDRTTNATGFIGDCTLEYIRTLDAGSWFDEKLSNERVPTLTETIQLLIELNLDANIEIKPCGDTAIQTTKTTLAIVKKLWPENKKAPLISSFNLQCLEQALIECPRYPRALLLDEWQEDCCVLAKQYQCISINVDHIHLTRERIARNNEAGFQTYAFTVNNRDRAKVLEQWGIAGIFSDNPTLLHPSPIQISEIAPALLKQKHTQLSPDESVFNQDTFNRFTLIGLPGVGKSTILSECIEIMKKKGVTCDLRSTDAIIRERMRLDDPVVIKFQEDNQLTFFTDVFASPEPTKAFIAKYGEEPLFRDLEAKFVADILEEAQQNDWFDLGGKAPLRKITEDKLHSKKIIPIFLFANESTILEHLQCDNNWRKRSNYQCAEETGLGWMKLAEAHRSERSSAYKDVGVIILSIDNKNPAEIAREILYQVKEVELVCRNRYNAFTRFNGAFFSCNSTKESNSKKRRFNSEVQQGAAHKRCFMLP